MSKTEELIPLHNRTPAALLELVRNVAISQKYEIEVISAALTEPVGGVSPAVPERIADTQDCMIDYIECVIDKVQNEAERKAANRQSYLEARRHKRTQDRMYLEVEDVSE